MEKEGSKEDSVRQWKVQKQNTRVKYYIAKGVLELNLYLVVGSPGEGERGYGPEGEVAWRERGE